MVIIEADRHGLEDLEPAGAIGVAFLVSDAASNATQQRITVDGGGDYVDRADRQ